MSPVAAAEADEPTQAKDARTVHERMVAILGELPAIGKNQKNAQQGFMFRGHDDVLNALNPLMAKHGVFVVPAAMGREVSQRSTKSGSVMFEVSLLIEFTFYGAGGDSVTARVWGEGTDSGDKATSKAHTMAFKTALNQAFSVSSAETADPDAHTPEISAGRKTPPRPAPRAGTPQAAGDFKSSPAPAAPALQKPSGLRTEQQADELLDLTEELREAGLMTAAQFVAAAKKLGVDAPTAAECIGALSVDGAADLLGRLKKLKANAARAAA